MTQSRKEFINYQVNLITLSHHYRKKYEQNLHYRGHIRGYYQRKYGRISEQHWMLEILHVSDYDELSSITALELIMLYEKLRQIIYTS